MSELTVDIQNVFEGSSVPADTQFQTWAQNAWLGEHPSEVTVRIVDTLESQSLNNEFRGKDKPTNVLSFPFEAPAGITVPLAGDLVICAPVVEREAAEQDKTPTATGRTWLFTVCCIFRATITWMMKMPRPWKPLRFGCLGNLDLATLTKQRKRNRTHERRSVESQSGRKVLAGTYITGLCQRA